MRCLTRINDDLKLDSVVSVFITVFKFISQIFRSVEFSPFYSDLPSDLSINSLGVSDLLVKIGSFSSSPHLFSLLSYLNSLADSLVICIRTTFIYDESEYQSFCDTYLEEFSRLYKLFEQDILLGDKFCEFVRDSERLVLKKLCSPLLSLDASISDGCLLEIVATKPEFEFLSNLFR
ncbi:hypothetical protein RCL1_004720 [Eukaryota sp. TZLM3-RCL]